MVNRHIQDVYTLLKAYPVALQIHLLLPAAGQPHCATVETVQSAAPRSNPIVLAAALAESLPSGSSTKPELHSASMSPLQSSASAVAFQITQ